MSPITHLLNATRTGWTRALPSRCFVCGVWPARPWGASWCAPCEAKWGRAVSRCQRCAARLYTPGATCGACLIQPPPLASCLAAVDYGYPWANIIVRLKKEHGAAWARPLAELMWPTIEQYFGHNLPTVWAPIALHPSKLRERGHNQAWALAQALSALAKAAQAPPHRLHADLLVRVREGLPQHELKLAARWANMRDSFAANPILPKSPVDPDNTEMTPEVLLVDDVYTTGATLHAAALVLQQQFGAKVHAVVFARTPPQRSKSHSGQG